MSNKKSSNYPDNFDLWAEEVQAAYLFLVYDRLAVFLPPVVSLPAGEPRLHAAYHEFAIRVYGDLREAVVDRLTYRHNRRLAHFIQVIFFFWFQTKQIFRKIVYRQLGSIVCGSAK